MTDTAAPATTPGAAARPPVLLQGLGPALVGGALVLASLPGPGVLLAAVAVAQVVLVLGVLALVDAPSSEAAFAVAVGALAAGDALVLLSDSARDDVGALAGVVAVAFVAALVLQLVRRGRDRVTEALADTLLVVVLVTCFACLVGLRDRDGGDEAVLVALAAAAACLLAGRVGDLVSTRPLLATGATRGWPGLLLGLGAGVAAASAVAGSTGAVSGSRGALLGLAVAATAATADLAVDLGAAELRAGRRDARRASALTPVGLFLPYAALAPVALVAGGLVLP